MGVRKKRSVVFRDPLVSSDTVGSASDQTVTRDSLDIVEETPPRHGQHSLQEDNVPQMRLLSTQTKSDEFVRIDIPSNLSPTSKKEDCLGATSVVYAGCSSSNSKTASRGLPPKPKSKFPSGTLNMEEVAILALGGLQPPPTERSPFLAKSLSVSELGTPIIRATSMPSGSVQPSNSKSTDDHYVALNSNGVGEQQPIYRSHSVPVNYADGTIRDGHIRVLRVVPKRIMTERNTRLASASSIDNGEEDQEDITEEEAVCRICFEEIGEELETFKLECNCKGDLALVHRQCSQKWFNLRGNKTCEICREEVRNITVKVRRMPAIDLSSLQQPPMIYADRLWHEFPILVVASIVGYFVATALLRKLRKGNEDFEGTYTILPSCILGLITSLAASAFAQRKYVWTYAMAQLLIFTVIAHFFYDLLHLKPLPSLIMAAIFAMGISGGAGPACRAIKKWRAARRNQRNNNPQDVTPPMNLQLTHEGAERHHHPVAGHHESIE